MSTRTNQKQVLCGMIQALSLIRNADHHLNPPQTEMVNDRPKPLGQRATAIAQQTRIPHFIQVVLATTTKPSFFSTCKTTTDFQEIRIDKKIERPDGTPYFTESTEVEFD